MYVSNTIDGIILASDNVCHVSYVFETFFWQSTFLAHLINELHHRNTLGNSRSV